MAKYISFLKSLGFEDARLDVLLGLPNKIISETKDNIYFYDRANNGVCIPKSLIDDTILIE